MSRKVAFFIVKLPIVAEYNAYENNTSPDARTTYINAYQAAYDQVKTAVQALNLPEGQNPSLWQDEFHEPYVYLINVSPALIERLAADGNKLGTFDVAPVPA